jgi:hypothetical protein
MTKRSVLVSDLVPTRSESSGSDRKLFHNTTVTPSHFVLLVKLMSIYITSTVLYLTLFFTDCFSGFCGYRHPAGGGRLGGGREQVQAGLDGQGRLYHQAQPSVGQCRCTFAPVPVPPTSPPSFSRVPCRFPSTPPVPTSSCLLPVPCRLAHSEPLPVQCRLAQALFPFHADQLTQTLYLSRADQLRPSSCPVPTSSTPAAAHFEPNTTAKSV